MVDTFDEEDGEEDKDEDDVIITIWKRQCSQQILWKTDHKDPHHDVWKCTCKDMMTC